MSSLAPQHGRGALPEAPSTTLATPSDLTNGGGHARLLDAGDEAAKSEPKTEAGAVEATPKAETARAVVTAPYPVSETTVPPFPADGDRSSAAVVQTAAASFEDVAAVAGEAASGAGTPSHAGDNALANALAAYQRCMVGLAGSPGAPSGSSGDASLLGLLGQHGQQASQPTSIAGPSGAAGSSSSGRPEENPKPSEVSAWQLFSAQARRIEAQLVQQLRDRKALETAQAHLLMVQRSTEVHSSQLRQLLIRKEELEERARALCTRNELLEADCERKQRACQLLSTQLAELRKSLAREGGSLDLAGGGTAPHEGPLEALAAEAEKAAAMQSHKAMQSHTALSDVGGEAAGHLHTLQRLPGPARAAADKDKAHSDKDSDKDSSADGGASDGAASLQSDGTSGHSSGGASGLSGSNSTENTHPSEQGSSSWDSENAEGGGSNGGSGGSITGSSHGGSSNGGSSHGSSSHGSSSHGSSNGASSNGSSHDTVLFARTPSSGAARQSPPEESSSNGGEQNGRSPGGSNGSAGSEEMTSAAACAPRKSSRKRSEPTAASASSRAEAPPATRVRVDGGVAPFIPAVGAEGAPQLRHNSWQLAPIVPHAAGLHAAAPLLQQGPLPLQQGPLPLSILPRSLPQGVLTFPWQGVVSALCRPQVPVPAARPEAPAASGEVEAPAAATRPS